MTTDIPPVVGFRYAGFWRRFVALIIDYSLVSILVFPLVVLMAAVAPGSIVVSVPFNLFTQERVLSTDTTQEKNADGSVTVVDVRMVEVTTLGKWTYLYRERIKHSAGRTETSRQLVDPNTKLDVKKRTADDITIGVLVLYWILLEASRVSGVNRQAGHGESEWLTRTAQISRCCRAAGPQRVQDSLRAPVPESVL